MEKVVYELSTCGIPENVKEARCELNAAISEKGASLNSEKSHEQESE
jgi:hypothetical protein